MTELDLGAKLKQIRDAKQAEADAAKQEQILKIYGKYQQERTKIRTFWLEYVAHVHARITKNQEPACRKVPDVFVQHGVCLDNPMHSHHDVWQEICTQASRLGLQPKLNYCHDGKGVTSWYEFSVEPLV